jgi:CheY-like chemotaxis protein
VNGERRRVLVIDDQEDERAIQGAMLGHLGYEVDQAADGAEGIRRAQEQLPDLVLLDIAMPRLDGLAVCRALRADARTASVPVLLFTASVAGDLEAIAREVGASGILAKPVNPQLVARTIAQLIGPARPAEPERAGPGDGGPA